MDILPSGNIFLELQDIHDTGYFSAQSSLEDHWQQVRTIKHFARAGIVENFSLPTAPFERLFSPI